MEIDLHEFKCGIYPRMVWIMIGTETPECLQVEDMDDSNCEASVDDAIRKEDMAFGFLLRFRSKKQMNHKTIAHESSHVAMMIFKAIGASVDLDNQEPFAYLVGWVADCCEKVKNYKGEKK